MTYQSFYGYPKDPFTFDRTETSEDMVSLTDKIEEYPRGIIFEVDKPLIEGSPVPYENVQWTYNVDRAVAWRHWTFCPETLGMLWR